MGLSHRGVPRDGDLDGTPLAAPPSCSHTPGLFAPCSSPCCQPWCPRCPLTFLGGDTAEASEDSEPQPQAAHGAGFGGGCWHPGVYRLPWVGGKRRPPIPAAWHGPEGAISRCHGATRLCVNAGTGLPWSRALGACPGAASGHRSPGENFPNLSPKAPVVPRLRLLATSLGSAGPIPASRPKGRRLGPEPWAAGGRRNRSKPERPRVCCSLGVLRGCLSILRGAERPPRVSVCPPRVSVCPPQRVVEAGGQSDRGAGGFHCCGDGRRDA